MYKSKNYSDRRGTKIDSIIIHHTDGKFPGCAEWLCNPASKVSAHWLITKTGDLHHLVDDKYAAWHSGYARWNRRSIGIELETSKDKADYTGQQMLALKLLLYSLMRHYGIPKENVLGHKEIAPGRKIDPAFDMDKFRSELPKILKGEL